MSTKASLVSCFAPSRFDCLAKSIGYSVFWNLKGGPDGIVGKVPVENQGRGFGCTCSLCLHLESGYFILFKLCSIQNLTLCIYEKHSKDVAASVMPLICIKSVVRGGLYFDVCDFSGDCFSTDYLLPICRSDHRQYC